MSSRVRSCLVRIRGLPWSAGPNDVQDFFAPLTLAAESPITFISGLGGKRTGEAYVRFESGVDAEKALRYNKATLGRRYIEVFSATDSDLEVSIHRQGPSRHCGDKVIRCRGLPFQVTVTEVSEFFAEYGVKDDHVTLDVHGTGRYVGSPNGEAWVTFRDEETAKRAYQKQNLKCIGSRYVELYLSSETERQQVQASLLWPRPSAWIAPGRPDRKARGRLARPKIAAWAQANHTQQKKARSAAVGAHARSASPPGRDEDEPSQFVDERPTPSVEEACEVAPHAQLASSDTRSPSTSSAASDVSEVGEVGEATDEDDSCVGRSPKSWYTPMPMEFYVVPVGPCAMPMDACAMLTDTGVMPTESCAMLSDPCAMQADPWQELPCESMNFMLGGNISMPYPQMYNQTFDYMSYGSVSSAFVDVAPCGSGML